MDVWTTLILLAALVVLITRTTTFFARRVTPGLRRRFTDLAARPGAGLSSPRSGLRAHFRGESRHAH